MVAHQQVGEAGYTCKMSLMHRRTTKTIMERARCLRPGCPTLDKKVADATLFPECVVRERPIWSLNEKQSRTEPQPLSPIHISLGARRA